MQTAIEITNVRTESKANGNDKAIVVARRGKILAILPPGDPLRRTLFLSADELREVIVTFPYIMRHYPQIRALMEAILELILANGSLEPVTNRQ